MSSVRTALGCLVALPDPPAVHTSSERCSAASHLLRLTGRSLPPSFPPSAPHSLFHVSLALARVPSARVQHPLLCLVLLPDPTTVSSFGFPYTWSLLYLDTADNLGGSANKRHLSSQNTSHRVHIPQAAAVLPARGAPLELSSYSTHVLCVVSYQVSDITF